MVLFTISILLSSPAIILLSHGEVVKGLSILAIAIFIGTLSFSIASYWHERDIHATLLGNIISLVLFIAGIVVLWIYGFYFWLPITILGIFMLYGFFTGTNKKK